MSLEHVRVATVDCAVYCDGGRLSGEVAVEAARAEAKARGGFVWIGLHDPDPAAVEHLGDAFGLHPLAVEDAVHAHQRPKLDVYEDLLVLVLKTARYDEAEELVVIGEVLVFLGDDFVVVVRHGEGSPLAGVRDRVEGHPELLELGPSAVLYAIADKVVDDYAAVLDGLEEDIEQIEADVFSPDPTNPSERIYRLKREVLEFRRAVNPLRGPIDRLATRAGDLAVDDRTREYFGDVQDHLVRDAERLQSFDDLLAGVLQANLAQLTVRDNADMRKLAAWAAIIAVPTMVFGLYGMNFEDMPELAWTYGYPLVLLVVAALCSGLFVRFKRIGWL